MTHTLIYAPSLYIVARPHLVEEGVLRYLTDEQETWVRSSTQGGVQDADLLCELGGRICYNSFGKAQSNRTTAAYLQNIIRQEHESVLEHANWTILVTGVSRSLSHELVRHRVGVSPSQLSQRYFDESEPEFVVPPELFNRPALLDLWQKTLDAAQTAYVQLREGILTEIERDEGPAGDFQTKRDRRIRASQAARAALPNATATQLQLTMNARAIRHILRMRGSLFAEPEIRRFAVALCRLMWGESATLFGDFAILTVPGAYPVQEYVEQVGFADAG